MNSTADGTPLRDDLLRSAEEISQFTGDSLRRTYYQLERGLLPGFKQGGKWNSLKSAIRRHYASKLKVQAK